MSNEYIIKKSTLTSIADAVREKSGTTKKIVVKDLPKSIMNIPSTGDYNIPDELSNYSGDCYMAFYNSYWNSFIENYGASINTQNITRAEQMFWFNGTIKNIPFEFNFADKAIDCYHMFGYCYDLESIGDFNNFKPEDTRYMFYSCYKLKHLPNFNNCDFSQLKYPDDMFGECYDLRSIPEDFLKQLSAPSGHYSIFHGGFSGCYVLDEIKGLFPQKRVYASTSSVSSNTNIFMDTFDECYRLKDITFAVQDDGTPYECKDEWNKAFFSPSAHGHLYDYGQSSYITGAQYEARMLGADKKVYDDATYQALKNDPDWWTIDRLYSRYNHDSAVRTINSLPIYTGTDTSSAPTISFGGRVGEKTDGGAINTLTPEEIAVATSRNWTVSIT